MFKKFDDARTQILTRVIDGSEQPHISPQITVLPPVEDFFRIWQPIEVFTSKPKFDRAAQATLLDRDFALDPEFSSLFDGDVIDVDLRIFPAEAKRTII